MAITRTAGQVQLDTVDDVVSYLAATAAQAIAAAGHPGHDLETVMTRMTTDQVLDTIRTAYTTWAERGHDRPAGIRQIGVRLIQEYCRTHGITGSPNMKETPLDSEFTITQQVVRIREDVRKAADAGLLGAYPDGVGFAVNVEFPGYPAGAEIPAHLASAPYALAMVTVRITDAPEEWALLEHGGRKYVSAAARLLASQLREVVARHFVVDGSRKVVCVSVEGEGFSRSITNWP